MNISDFIPHGMVAALGGVVAYVFKEHTARDDARFDRIAANLDAIGVRQTQIADKMSENHAEILRVLLEAEQQRTSNEKRAESRG